MKRILTILTLLALSLTASAQVDRHDVRAGNRKFKKEEYKQAEIDYRKAVVKDSLSLAGEYNLASTLYRQEDYDGAGKALDAIKDLAPASEYAGDYYFNQGDIALQKEDYAAAVEAFK
ncbi:MAG: tetratricopeptide repeat protein, partial [Bacteroidales bacterium]|nr:tetratricopeptide repeat protein [Bacteroidales bacterium]